MKTSVYSLVLMDEVVEAVDRLAYHMQTSRSNLINQILAEKLAVTTPEMHMKDVFDSVEEILGGYQHFQIQQQAADSMISIKSVLKYKYNPTVRYAINLNRNQSESLGELRLISRSQSAFLLQSLSTFFERWSLWEQENQLPGWQLDASGRWFRTFLKVDESIDPSHIAIGIAHYIHVVDEGIKLQCDCLVKEQTNQEALKNHFNQFIKNQKVTI